MTLVSSMRDKNLIRTGRNNSFQVYVKKKGKYVKLGKPTTRNNALDLGSRYVDSNPSAVFKIVKSNERPVFNKNAIDDFFAFNLNKFRAGRIMNKREQKFTEKEIYRIDTKGEKEGISIKGIQKRRVKKIFDL